MRVVVHEKFLGTEGGYTMDEGLRKETSYLSNSTPLTRSTPLT